MTTSIYSETTEQLRSRIQNQIPQGPSIRAATQTRKTFTVFAADGEPIEIPLSYLSDVAAIEVEGSAPDRPGPVRFHYMVEINNSAKLDSMGQHKLNRLAVDEEFDRGARAVKQKAYDGAADDLMNRTGLQRKLAGKARDQVHNPLHKAASSVGRRIGVSGTSTTRLVRYVSKQAAEATAKQAGRQVARGILGFLFGKGVGVIGMILESNSIGYSAVKYGQSKERKFPVVFSITGDPKRKR